MENNKNIMIKQAMYRMSDNSFLSQFSNWSGSLRKKSQRRMPLELRRVSCKYMPLATKAACEQAPTLIILFFFS